MKKILPILLACVLILLISCVSINKIKIGMVKNQTVAEELFIKAYGKSVTFWSEEINCKQIFFNDMTAMIVALRSGQIDELSTYESVGKYLADRNQDFEWVMSNPVLIDGFCFAMREEDLILQKEFDDALAKMNSDGTLSKLVKSFIDASYHDYTPTLVDMPYFYDAPTVKIGFTGELPPFDLITDEGKPAGFNTAVLAEISERIGKNFELVQVEQENRVAALNSHEVDVLFWKLVPDNDKFIPDGFNQPAGILLTEPYFSDEIIHLRLRK